MPRSCRSAMPVVERMEDRILHSADLLPAAGLEGSGWGAAQQQTLSNQAAPGVVQTQRHEIVFVDASLSDAQTLLAGLSADGVQRELVWIAADSDGLALISQTLAGRQGIDAIHLISHGSAGQVQLGGSVLDAASLLARAGEVSGWADALGPGADLLIYGCDVAGSDAGLQLVRDLAALTGADVAASTDVTGAVALAGNWILEATTGVIETRLAPSLAAQAAWQGTLATFVADPSKADGAVGSLRWAISQANVTPGVDTVQLLAGTHTLTLVNPGGIAENSNATGDLDLLEGIVLLGASSNAADTVISMAANVNDRVFDVLAGTATMRDLTIQGGRGVSQGGGVNVGNAGAINLSNVVLRDNSANNGGAIYNLGNATLNQVRISNNTASATGGGFNNRGVASFTDVWFDGNQANSGGGLSSQGGSSSNTLNKVSFSGNTALSSGGGIYGLGGSLSASNVTVSGNSAAYGGGVYAANLGWSFSNASIVGNTGTTGTGGIYGSVQISLKNSILASNTGGNANIALTSLGYNIDTDNSALFYAATDLRPTAAAVKLQPLAANGGFAPTLALGMGSVAINAGDPGAPATDQRGVARQGVPDIGAYEYTVLAVNVAPLNSLPAPPTALEDMAKSITGLSVIDGNAGGGNASWELASTQLSVSSGKLSVVLAGAASISAGANGGAMLRISGNQTDINNTLASLSYLGNPNFAGSDTLLMLSTDGLGLIDSDNLAISVTAVNDPPRGTSATLSINEDTPHTLARADFGFADTAGESHGFASVLVQVPSAGSLKLSGTKLTVATEVSVAQLDAGALVFTPVLDAFGPAHATLAFQVRDNGGTANGGIDLDPVQRVLTFDVQPVNDAPVITSNGGGATATIGVAENTTAVTTVIATDVDSASLSYSLAGGADAARFSIDPSTGVLRFLVAPDFEAPGDADLNNVYEVIVRVSDGALTTTQALSVTVNDVVEAAPAMLWFSTAGPQSTPVGGVASWSAGKVLQFGNAGDKFDTDGTNTTSGTLDVLGGFTPPVPLRGMHYVQTSLVIGTTGPKFTLLKGDLILVLDPGGSASVALNTGDGNPANDFSADRQDLVVYRPASAGNYGSGEYFMLFNDSIHDGAPTAGSPPYNVHAITLVETATTVGGTTLPAGTFLVANSTKAIHNNIYTFSGIGTGLGSGLAGTTATKLLLNGYTLGLNNAPTDPYQIQGLHILSNPTFIGSTQFAAGTVLVAVNGDDIYAGVPQTPFDIVALTITRTQQDSTPGTIATGTLLFDGSDLGLSDPGRTGASNIGGFTLVGAGAANSAPYVASGIANAVATQDTAFSHVFGSGSFADTDPGDSLSYGAKLSSGATLPGWLSFDAASRKFSGTPLNAHVGTVSVRVTATDTGSATAFTDFLITVANVNDAPTVAVPIPNQTVNQGQALNFSFAAGSFNDIDVGDSLSYSARLANGAALPSWLSFNAATRTFSGTPANADVGALDVRVTASDGEGASAFCVFQLSVKNVNDAPTLVTAIGNRVAVEGLLFDFRVPAGSFDDIDVGDVLSYSAKLASGGALPSWLSFNAATQRFSGTPANSDVGALTVRVIASDTSLAIAYDDFNLTVANVNDAPTLVTPLVDQAATQGLAFAYTVPAGSFADIDVGDVLTYSAKLSSGAALPGWLSFDAAIRSFSGTPANADVGMISVRVTATDVSLASVYDDFNLTVANVNDAPVLVNPLADQLATQGQAFSYILPAGSFVDIDVGDVLSYSASLRTGSVLPAWLSFDAATQTFSGTPAKADLGVIRVRVTATDASAASAQDEFRLRVINVNVAPVLVNPLADQNATQDVALSFAVPAGSFADLDADDILTYSAKLSSGAALPAWLSFNATTQTFSGMPANADVGLISVRVIATDESLASAQGDFQLGVANVNDAPVLVSPLADQMATQGLAFSFSVPVGSFADIDVGDSLTYSAKLSSGAALPGWLSFNATTQTFNGTPANADVGAVSVRVTASDGSATSAYDDFKLTVANVNDAPVLVNPLEDQAATQGVAFSFAVPAGSFADIDVGDILNYSAKLSNGAALPGWLSFNDATGSFSGTPANANVGLITVRVTATDSSAASAYGDFKLAVANVNDAPTLVTPLADQAANQGQTFAYTVPAGSFADIDVGDSLIYSAKLSSGAALPAWLSFNASTRSFGGTPANADVGAISVRVTATDGSATSAYDDFKLTVANVNDAPVLVSPLEDQAATQGVAFSFTLPAGSFADIDVGDILNYSAKLSNGAALPGWLSFNAATQTFSGTAANADVGVISVRVSATDSAAASATADFRLDVANVNDAPTLTRAMPNQQAARNQPFSFNLPAGSFSDVDVGDSLRYSATLANGSALPGWLSFDAGSQRFSGTPVLADIGSLSVRITATDNAGASASGELAINVAMANQAPRLAVPITDQQGSDLKAFSFDVPAGTFLDADADDALRLSATLADGAPLPTWLRFDAESGRFTGTPTGADQGRIVVRLTASDPFGAQAQTAFAVLVINSQAVLAAPLAPLAAPTAAVAPAAAAERSAEPASGKAATESAAKPAAPSTQGTAAAPPMDLLAIAPEPIAAARANAYQAEATAPAEPNLTSRVTTPTFTVADVALVAESSEIRLAPMLRLFSSDDMMRRLDGGQLQRRLLEQGDLHGTLMASSTAVASSLSIGYVVWLVRGGVLMSSMLSSLPAWQMMDPLPVVAARGAARFDGSGGDGDDDVERLFDKTSRQPSTPPPPDVQPALASAPAGAKETS